MHGIPAHRIRSVAAVSRRVEAPAPASAIRPKHFRTVLAASAVPAAIGLIVIYGWASSELSLTNVLAGGRAMQPLTAAGLIGVGATLAALAAGWRRAAAAGALLVLVLGLQAGVQTIAGIDLETDTLLFETEIFRQGPVVVEPGRISLLSALLFLLFAISSHTIGSNSRWRCRLAVICSTVGISASFFALIGFVLLLGDPLPGVEAALVMPLHTAVALSAAFAGLMLLRPNASWIRLLLSRGWTGKIAKLSLATATVPIPIAWLAERGHRAGLYGTDVRLLLIVAGAVLLLAVLALKSASLLGRERRERDEFLRALDQSPNLSVDAHSRIIYWSQGCEELYGWSADEAKGRLCHELLGDCGPLVALVNDTQSSQNGGWQGELQHRSMDGRELSILARCIVYSRGEERLPTVLLSITDLTEEQRARNELFKRDEALTEVQRQLLEVSRLSSMGELAAGLAHELNQPLTATANFLGAAEMALQNDENLLRPDMRQKIRDAVARAKNEALRGGEIVRRLREFIARGEADTRLESLSKLVREAVQLALPPSSRKSIDVQLKLSPEADSVLVDRVQIQQVVVNLVKNAAEAMAGQQMPPPTLTISSAPAEDGMVEVSVSDTGPGLAEEVAAKLFSPFTSSKATGMGVGLSICKRIVEAHGGHIWTTPVPSGGTNFRFTLPALSHSEDVDE